MTNHSAIKQIAILVYCCIIANLYAVEDINALVKKVKKSVVNISVETHHKSKSSNDNESQPLGSGVIINPEEGIIITCAHVIKDAKHLLITLNDKRRFIGKIIGLDDITDLALLQIDADHLSGITVAAEDEFQLGDSVIAIGSPYGLNDSVTFGIISSLNRDLNITRYDNYIQTDAQINFGNSGGALINSQGHLVGINASILTTLDQLGNSSNTTGIGFAIPVEVFKPISKQILTHGNVDRGMIGAYIQPLHPQLASALNSKTDAGILLSDIIEGGPSEAAELQVGDLITHVNNTRVETSNHLSSLIGTTRAGDKTTLRVIRDNKEFEQNLTVSSQIKKNSTHTNSLTGLTYADYQITDGNGHLTKGAMILEVTQGSSGWVSGLKAGDIILEVNHNPITNSQDLSKITDLPGPLLVRAQRDQIKFFLSIN